MREQIISFLAQGFGKDSVLKTVGCSAAFYDSLLQEPEFIEELAIKKTEYQQERVERHYNKVEEQALKKLSENIDFMEPAQLCRILDTVARNKVAYRKPANTYQNPTAALQITVNMPQPALNQKVILDSNSQVVAIGDRVMTALPLQNVKELFSKLDPVKELKNDLEISEASLA